MEDFGPVLWILIAGGAMAYSAITNAKKQAQKRKNLPHQEAWPMQMLPTEDSKRGNVLETMTSEIPGEIPEHESQTPWSYDGAYEEEIEAGKIEAQSLEEIPAHKPEVRQNSPKHAKIATSDIKSITTQAIAEISSEETTAEIAETFELRKAVIYSEILKPKFDE